MSTPATRTRPGSRKQFHPLQLQSMGRILLCNPIYKVRRLLDWYGGTKYRQRITTHGTKNTPSVYHVECSCVHVQSALACFCQERLSQRSARSGSSMSSMPHLPSCSSASMTRYGLLSPYLLNLSDAARRPGVDSWYRGRVDVLATVVLLSGASAVTTMFNRLLVGLLTAAPQAGHDVLNIGQLPFAARPRQLRGPLLAHAQVGVRIARATSSDTIAFSPCP